MAVSLSLLPNAQAEEKAMVPLRPAELLKLLPPAETGWRMAVSNAQDIPDAWPRTKAVRQFVLEGPGPSSQGSTATLAKCQLTIIDTGGHPDTKALFAQSGAGGPGAPSVSTVAGMPALRKDSGGKQKLEVLALDRFVLIAELEITGTNPPLGNELSKPDKWLERINLDALRAASKNPAFLDVSKNHAMTVERIDEINPRKSARSNWSFSVEPASEN
jgi:hypothetical protein